MGTNICAGGMWFGFWPIGLLGEAVKKLTKTTALELGPFQFWK